MLWVYVIVLKFFDKSKGVGLEWLVQEARFWRTRSFCTGASAAEPGEWHDQIRPFEQPPDTVVKSGVNTTMPRL